MKRALFLLIAAVITVSGCKPRGETHSLAELMEIAKARLSTAQTTQLDGAAAALVSAVLENIDETLQSPESKETYVKVANAISDLIIHAGYTSRPGLTELSHQYMHASTESVTDQRATLLALRAYHALASEMETNRFRF